VLALKVISSYINENSIPPCCVSRLMMERIAKPHAYTPDLSELELHAKCGQSPLLYHGSHSSVNRGRK